MTLVKWDLSHAANHLLMATACKLAGNFERKQTFSSHRKYYNSVFLATSITNRLA